MAWILYTGTSRALYTGNTPSGPWRGDTYPVSLFSHNEDHDDSVREDYDYFEDQNDDLEDHDDLPVNTPLWWQTTNSELSLVSKVSSIAIVVRLNL